MDKQKNWNDYKEFLADGFMTFLSLSTDCPLGTYKNKSFESGPWLRFNDNFHLETKSVSFLKNAGNSLLS